MIGASILDEYRKHIENDAALERWYQTVPVDEPDVEDTVSILRGLREAPRSLSGRADSRWGAGGGGQAVAPVHH